MERQFLKWGFGLARRPCPLVNLNLPKQRSDIDPEKFLSQAEQLIPAEFIMIRGCEDWRCAQTAMDVENVASRLPNPEGRAGGACTSNLLELLYDHDKHHTAATTPPFTFQQLWRSLRSKLEHQGLPQIPQLTSSRPVDMICYDL